MKLFVGLGNPGKEYEGTRHNMGFITINKFADMAGTLFDRSAFKGEYGTIKNPAFPDTVIILKPQTFMNLSGESVQPLAAYFKIDPKDIVVVYDDMALSEGMIRLREGGTSGGHKGMQSVIDLLGTDKIHRIRIGIGEPPHKDAVDYVLGKPSGASLLLLNQATDEAAKALRDIEVKGFSYAMTHYNAPQRSHS